MSDGRVRAAIEQMEAWLADPIWDPDPKALAQWNLEFQTALVQAEKAPGWIELIARAHVAGRLMETRIVAAVEAQDRIRTELALQEQGTRALRGYDTSAR
jgi:hypothetical protein